MSRRFTSIEDWLAAHPLPVGSVAVEPFTKEFDRWVSQEVDAKLERHGITWWRVRGGFSNQWDREDWIADLPGVSLSAHDYNWNGGDFGRSYEGGFEGALDGLVADAIPRVEADEKRAALALIRQQASLATLQAAHDQRRS